ncbi:hypothetical protein ACSQ67_025815 [Phaseolus vulgaris]
MEVLSEEWWNETNALLLEVLPNIQTQLATSDTINGPPIMLSKQLSSPVTLIKTDKSVPNRIEEPRRLHDGRNVDVVDADGRTVLLFVAGLGFELCVKPLAEASANPYHRDRNEGLAALHMAVGYVRPHVAKLPLDLGADPEVADDHGRLAFDPAMFKYVEMREILERRGFMSVFAERKRGEEW